MVAPNEQFHHSGTAPRLRVTGARLQGALSAQCSDHSSLAALRSAAAGTYSNGGLTGSIPNSTTDYIWSGSRVVEERNAGNTPVRQYVWGTYIDELIQLTTLVPLGPQNLSPGTYYLLQDLLYRADIARVC